MAKINSDLLPKGLSGRVGNLVFRQYNGKTIVAAAPGPRKQPLSKKQMEQQKRFIEATRYAKAILINDDARRFYDEYAKQHKCVSTYVAALKDYLHSGGSFTAPLHRNDA